MNLKEKVKRMMVHIKSDQWIETAARMIKQKIFSIFHEKGRQNVTRKLADNLTKRLKEKEQNISKTSYLKGITIHSDKELPLIFTHKLKRQYSFPRCVHYSIVKECTHHAIAAVAIKPCP